MEFYPASSAMCFNSYNSFYFSCCSWVYFCHNSFLKCNKKTLWEVDFSRCPERRIRQWDKARVSSTTYLDSNRLFKDIWNLLELGSWAPWLLSGKREEANQQNTEHQGKGTRSKTNKITKWNNKTFLTDISVTIEITVENSKEVHEMSELAFYIPE